MHILQNKYGAQGHKTNYFGVRTKLEHLRYAYKEICNEEIYIFLEKK